MDIPMPGHAPIKLNSKSNYVFKRIDGERAIFEIQTTFIIKSPPQDIQITAEGNGSGVMTYNIKTRLIERREMGMAIQMRARSGKLLVTTKLHGKSSVQQYLVQPGESPNKAQNPTGTPSRFIPTG